MLLDIKGLIAAPLTPLNSGKVDMLNIMCSIILSVFQLSNFRNIQRIFKTLFKFDLVVVKVGSSKSKYRYSETIVRVKPSKEIVWLAWRRLWAEFLTNQNAVISTLFDLCVSLSLTIVSVYL